MAAALADGIDLISRQDVARSRTGARQTNRVDVGRWFCASVSRAPADNSWLSANRPRKSSRLIPTVACVTSIENPPRVDRGVRSLVLRPDSWELRGLRTKGAPDGQRDVSTEGGSLQAWCKSTIFPDLSFSNSAVLFCSKLRIARRRGSITLHEGNREFMRDHN